VRVVAPKYNRRNNEHPIPGSFLSALVVTCLSSFPGSPSREVYGTRMRSATMFEPGITPTPPSPIEGEGFTLPFHGQLFTKHYI